MSVEPVQMDLPVPNMRPDLLHLGIDFAQGTAEDDVLLDASPALVIGHLHSAHELGYELALEQLSHLAVGRLVVLLSPLEAPEWVKVVERATQEGWFNLSLVGAGAVLSKLDDVTYVWSYVDTQFEAPTLNPGVCGAYGLHNQDWYAWYRTALNRWTNRGDLVVEAWPGGPGLARACLLNGRRYLGRARDQKVADYSQAYLNQYATYGVHNVAG